MFIYLSILFIYLYSLFFFWFFFLGGGPHERQVHKILVSFNPTPLQSKKYFTTNKTPGHNTQLESVLKDMAMEDAENIVPDKKVGVI